MFFGFIPTKIEISDLTTHSNEFRRQALLYHMRRERCTGTWRVTYNSIELVDGACNEPPLPDDEQKLFTEATMALPQWYMTSLAEHLGPFTERNDSRWLLPATCTVIAGMYWSRVAAFNTMSLWALDKTTDQAILGPNQNRSSNTYYHVVDTVTSSRRTMNASQLLYFILAVYPILTILLFAATLLLHHVPLDGGFGTVALLAGVRVETLKLLKGASKSGKLRKSIRVTINADQGSMTKKCLRDERNEYILT